jgi:hypothetical protein
MGADSATMTAASSIMSRCSIILVAPPPTTAEPQRGGIAAADVRMFRFTPSLGRGKFKLAFNKSCLWFAVVQKLLGATK